MEREILAIKKYYKNIGTSVKIYDKVLKEFEVKVGVYQGFVFNPLLFAVMIAVVTKDVGECGEKDDLWTASR